MSSELQIVAVSVGNTRTRVGVFRGESLEHNAAIASDSIEEIGRAILEAPGVAPTTPVFLASVNTPASNRLEAVVTPRLEARGAELVRFGKDIDIPIRNTLTDDSTVGQDRLLNALGAFHRAKQACIVVDCGTAITVDFVDGAGVFQGGAIAPGLSMMLAALHRHTAALPEISFELVPDLSPFGKDTAQAMRLGAQSAARGLVRVLAERYSEFYGAYPQIIATGGDSRALFETDDLVEHLVPDLTLMGIRAACQIHADGGLDPDDADDTDDARGRASDERDDDDRD